MLDMAFQLLTFFILTYHPAPSEGQFIMNLLPAQPATNLDAKAESESTQNSDLPASVRTMPTLLYASAGGKLGRIVLSNQEQPDLAAFEKQLAQDLQNPDLAFDQALIKFDPDLKYSELIQVVNIFSKLKLTKISFSEMSPEEMSAP
ncbi:MAG: biopolymer transporter ExbD [Planctomycetota bacterium]|nr:biopolymer transporter ExbD [Planctomycetota bacterium]